METVQQAKNNFSALRAERREIEYPAKCKSVNAKDKHKEKTLCGSPEVLFTDYAQQKEGRKKNNLIFFTDSIYIWKDTLCSNYAYVSREGIGSGGRLNICKDEHLDKDDPLLTITYYTKGKLRWTQRGSMSPLMSPLTAIENPNTLSISAPPTPASSNNRLKESMALLELDFAEFKERTQARQSGPPDNTLQQLKEDLQQLKRDNEALASDLRGSVEALKQRTVCSVFS
ncbi:Schlafen family member 9 [Dissostichus eleginoides]|uniref:Schlafen family member 9 n=1 Tax=Dissostichus eleginoides TaxID=100907 RepID=A0AAD9ERM7_DISEL|nr:Schlafen family member 9 [Dissostichus eleginoides]